MGMGREFLMAMVMAAPLLATEAVPTKGTVAVDGASPTFVDGLDRDSLSNLLQTITQNPPRRRLRVQKIVGAAEPNDSNRLIRQSYSLQLSPGIRCKLIESVGKSGDVSQLPWLRLRLNEKSVAVRCYAAWAMGELRSSQAADALVKLQSSRPLALRLVALDALGKIAETSAQDAALFRGLQDSDVQVRYVAASALGYHPHPALARSMHEILRTEPSAYVQEALAVAVGKSADDTLSLVLVEQFAQESSPALRRALGRSLEVSSSSRVTPALQKIVLKSPLDMRLQAARVMARRPAVALSPELRRMLNRGKPQDQIVVLNSLGAGTEGDILEDVTKLLLSKHADVRHAATQAVQRLGSMGADTLSAEELP